MDVAKMRIKSYHEADDYEDEDGDGEDAVDGEDGEDGEDGDEIDGDEDDNPRQLWPEDEEDESRISDFAMNEKTFALLTERLPNSSGLFKIILELEEGFIRVRAVPGTIHGLAANAYTFDVLQWSMNNNSANPRPLRCTGDGSMQPSFIKLM
jgi:hypothetical protein